VEALLVLIPLSLGLMGLAAWALVWAIERGQFDEIGEQGRSVLDDDPAPSVEDEGLRRDQP
jgi:cbb3-type cytochrome oxidase maturation protein